MTREEKIAQIIREIGNAMGNNYKVEVKETIKNNGVKLIGIMISDNVEGIYPLIHIDGIIDEPVEEIVKYVISTYEDNKNNIQVDTIKCITDYEKAKDKLTIRLINKESNKEMLKDVPHEDFLDLAIIMLIQVVDNATIKVTNDILSQWEMTFDEILPVAKRNYYQSGMVFKSTREFVAELMEIPLESIPDEEPSRTLTNKNSLYGAGFITSNSIMQDIAGTMQSDLIIIPSSVHEVIITPLEDFMDCDKMSAMVQEVNETLKPDIILSDHIYIYKRKTGWEV